MSIVSSLRRTLCLLVLLPGMASAQVVLVPLLRFAPYGNVGDCMSIAVWDLRGRFVQTYVNPTVCLDAIAAAEPGYAYGVARSRGIGSYQRFEVVHLDLVTEAVQARLEFSTPLDGRVLWLRVLAPGELLVAMVAPYETQGLQLVRLSFDGTRFRIRSSLNREHTYPNLSNRGTTLPLLYHTAEKLRIDLIDVDELRVTRTLELAATPGDTYSVAYAIGDRVYVNRYGTVRALLVIDATSGALIEQRIDDHLPYVASFDRRGRLLMMRHTLLDPPLRFQYRSDLVARSLDDFSETVLGSHVGYPLHGLELANSHHDAFLEITEIWCAVGCFMSTNGGLFLPDAQAQLVSPIPGWGIANPRSLQLIGEPPPQAVPLTSPPFRLVLMAGILLIALVRLRHDVRRRHT